MTDAKSNSSAASSAGKPSGSSPEVKDETKDKAKVLETKAPEIKVPEVPEVPEVTETKVTEVTEEPPVEAPQTPKAPEGKELFVFTRKHWDGRVVHNRGDKAYFKPGKQPKNAVPIEEFQPKARENVPQTTAGNERKSPGQ